MTACLAFLLGCGQDRGFLPAAVSDGAAVSNAQAPPVTADPVREPPTSSGLSTQAVSPLADTPTASAGSGSAGPAEATPSSPGVLAEEPAALGPPIWGIVGIRGYPYGDVVAPNGVEYHQLFSLDLDLNFWLWRSERVYLFADARFWGQKPGAGVTNANQGSFDFSKREFDFTLGAAWNYYDNLEARVFAYSFNNLNRGASEVRPSGYADGLGLENRYYLFGSYGQLGTPDYDLARATFLSLGYYPSKDMVDGSGADFKPGPFARAYLTWPLLGPRCYLFFDSQFIADRSLSPKLLYLNGGAAARPFLRVPHLEFRLGTEDTYDLQLHDWETSVYGALRFLF